MLADSCTVVVCYCFIRAVAAGGWIAACANWMAKRLSKYCRCCVVHLQTSPGWNVGRGTCMITLPALSDQGTPCDDEQLGDDEHLGYDEQLAAQMSALGSPGFAFGQSVPSPKTKCCPAQVTWRPDTIERCEREPCRSRGVDRMQINQVASAIPIQWCSEQPHFLQPAITAIPGTALCIDWPLDNLS